MEFLLDPGIWVGLLTLIVLEIVLGIDNLGSVENYRELITLAHN